MATPAAFQPLHKTGLVISYETNSDTRIPPKAAGLHGFKCHRNAAQGMWLLCQGQCCALAMFSGPPMGTGAEGRWQLGAGEGGGSSRPMER